MDKLKKTLESIFPNYNIDIKVDNNQQLVLYISNAQYLRKVKLNRILGLSETIMELIKPTNISIKISKDLIQDMKCIGLDMTSHIIDCLKQEINNNSI